MIQLGEFNTLKVIRKAEHGLYLGTSEVETVLLPNRYCPKDMELGDDLNVFVYQDKENRPIATTLIPLVTVNQFGLLKVKSVGQFGAFMDWGIAKDLLVPFSQQYKKLEEGKSYVIHLYLDEVSDRLVGSAKIPNFLMTEVITVKTGDEAHLMVYDISELGASVIINNMHKGLVFKDEIYQDIKVGDKLKGYIKEVRKDNKIDVSLRPFGYRKVEPNADKILEYLQSNDGAMNITDKSAPELISQTFGMSKKVFKKAIGALYKQRLISLHPDKITLNND